MGVEYRETVGRRGKTIVVSLRQCETNGVSLCSTAWRNRSVKETVGVEYRETVNRGGKSIVVS